MYSSKRTCLNNPDCFCVICGEYMFQKFRLNVPDFVKKAYFDYFGFPLPSNAKPWIPSLLCKSCVKSLRLWANKKRPTFKYKAPMIWCQPSNIMTTVILFMYRKSWE